ncbi:hypothetical protein ACFLZB_00135 [Nanoarchaeota archaeon]
MADVNPSKTVRFAQLLAEASEKRDAGQSNRDDLNKQLAKVKKMAALPGVKRTFRQELEKLEDMVLQVASLETEILKKEDKDIRDLKNQISSLKSHLSLTKTDDLKPKIERINFLIAELSSRINTFINIKTDRERRMEELEIKIKEKMEENFEEITKLEKQVASLEQKYESLKSSGKHSEEQLDKISNRLAELREKLITKRIEVVEKKKQELRTMGPSPKPVPPPQMFHPQSGPVKHKMIFPEAPEPPRGMQPPRELQRPMMFPKMPEKNLEFKELPPPPPKKKKGMVAWLKRLVS